MATAPMLSSFPVDQTLTPQTAQERGYTWILDIIADLPDGLVSEIAKLVREKGWKLGQTRHLFEEHELGLYKPA